MTVDVLVTYDVSTVDPGGQRRLARVAATCERYGHRVQYSVFECRIDDVLLERLIGELALELDTRFDSVCIYRLGASFEAARISIGTSVYSSTEPWVL